MIKGLHHTFCNPLEWQFKNNIDILYFFSAPTSTVFLPGNKTSRNIIFAGNTLPQGAIPIQINGLNAIPLSAVKSLPISISNMAAGAQTVAKRTKVEIIPANGKTPLTSALPIVTKVTNNNTGNTSGLSQVLKDSARSKLYN